jgi:hypothetical protein
LLELQGENAFRIRSYRDGAATVRQAEQSVSNYVIQDRVNELRELPNIGKGIAAVIAEYVSSGASDLLNRLETEADPVPAFVQIAGIERDLARRVVDELQVKTLEDLEQTAYDGRLEKVEGVDAVLVKTIRTSLAGHLSGAAQNRVERQSEPEEPAPTVPPVDLLLEIDRLYRKKAAAGQLKTIAPKRLNPNGEAWLPVMNVKREGWEFTALFSNTAQAHRLGKIHEWVVIYFEQEGRQDQVTIVTPASGELQGKRVVRGRELETSRYYEDRKRAEKER